MYLRAATILFARPLTRRAAMHTSASARFPASQKHSTDAYNKDVDTTPPEDSTTYMVDPEADVQKSDAPASGEWSKAGTLTSEYENVNTTTQPYAAPGQSQRYGNMNALAKDKGPETDDGPNGKASGGRKPEKKSS